MTLEGEFQLGDRRVRPHTNTVVGPEGETHVEPKAMQVLAFLAERSGRVVSKHEILAQVWKGTFVSEEVLPNAIWELRKALGDDAKRPRFIQTLPKTGYRLIARVRPAWPRWRPMPKPIACGVSRWSPPDWRCDRRRRLARDES